MFNSTHTLVGLALGRAGLNNWTPWATATAVLAANFPDIDIFSAYYGPTFYLAHHRGFTHSILGVILLSFGLTVLIYLANALLRKWYRPGLARVRFKPLLAVALIAMLTHPLLDYTNSYGTRLFLPFSTHWYAWDIVYIISPYLDVGLFIGVLLSFWRRERGCPWAVGALFFVVAFWGVCTLSHRQAQRVLSASTVHGERPIAVGAFPTALNPFAWNSVFETAEALHVVRISPWDSPGDLSPQVTAVKPKLDAVIQHALDAPSVRVFMDFGRFVVPKVEVVPEGYRVIWMDFRSYDPVYHVGFSAAVTLSPKLEVLSDNFTYRRLLLFD